MNRTCFAFVFWLTLLAAWPAVAVDWQLVDNSNTTLWYDDDSVDWDDEDYVYFDIFHGAWAGADHMTANSIELSYDCWEGDGYTWNAWTDEWDYSDAYTDHESLSDMAFWFCW